jgi:quinol monooxygenase YgiN
MVMSTVRIVASNEKFHEVLETIKYILERFRVKTGCIHCRVYQDIEKPQALVFEDRWETQDALKNHIRSADYQIVLSLMEMSLQPPEVSIYSCLSVSGIDFIGNIRAGQGEGGIC